MTGPDPMPKLCRHEDPSWCGPDCEEKVRQFDEWMQRNLKDNRRSTLTQQGEVHARKGIGREARVEHQPQGADEVPVGVSAGGDEGMPGCGSMGDSVSTTIVEQLRFLRRTAKFKFAKDQFYMVGKVMHEAADEIERLRAELKSIAEYDCPGSLKTCPGCAACDARRALTESQDTRKTDAST